MIKDDTGDPLAHLGSVKADGSRIPIHPMEIDGKYIHFRKYVFMFFLGAWLFLPWIHINDKPAFQMDIMRRQFHFLGESYNAQDTWLLFFVITGTAFSLFVVSALWGRIWCGFACPHTVMLEFLYRPVERFFEGRPNQRKRRDLKGAKNWNFDDWRRKIGKWFVYLIWSLGLAHCAVAYFVSLPRLWEMVRHSPYENWEVFVWMSILTGLFYGNFAWFREQMCLVLCPYGRMQSILADEDTIIVGYDILRGEPRGRAKKNSTEKFGDCINCKKCVVVCPTAIDIRNGHQIECIGCMACIDACDSMMDKIGKPRGLIRFDSMNGLNQKPKRFLRPRLFLYLIAGVAGLIALSVAAVRSRPISAIALRGTDDIYIINDQNVRNVFQLHIENKRSRTVELTLGADLPKGFTMITPMPSVNLAAREGRHVPVIFEIPKADYSGDMDLYLNLFDGKEIHPLTIRFIGPIVGEPAFEPVDGEGG